jgi:hypothetical protein
MPAKPNKEGKLKFLATTVNFTQRQLDGLTEIAKLEKKDRSEVMRDAVDFYLLKHGKDQIDLHQTQLAVEMRRIQNDLRTLLIKNIKLTGENLYWSSLHWADGPPKARFNDEGFNHHWKRAEAFAAVLLRPKAKKGQEAEASQTTPETDPTPPPKTE